MENDLPYLIGACVGIFCFIFLCFTLSPILLKKGKDGYEDIL